MGWGGSIEDWPKPLIELLASHFKTVIFDNRGTGRTSKPNKPYIMADYANDAAKLTDILKWGKSHVMGISFDGMVTQEPA